MRRLTPPLVVMVVALLTVSARAQIACGDLNADGSVNSADALILRGAFSAATPMSPAQLLACDVISELGDPGALCSVVDSAVMARTGAALEPGVTPVCPLGVLAECYDDEDSDGDGFAGYPTDPGCLSANDSDETDDCPDGPNCPACADTLDEDFDGMTDYPNDGDCTAASDTIEGNWARVPLAPTALTATPGNSQVTVNWTVDGTSGASITDHLVTTRLAGGAFVGSNFTGSGAGGFTVIGLANGTSYYFQVRSINSLGIGAVSANSNLVTPGDVPEAPAAPSAVRTPGIGASIDVSWSAPPVTGSPIINYEIEVSASGIATFTTTTTGATPTSKTIGGLVTCNYGQASQICSRGYQFRVRARSGANYGAYSAPSTSVVPAVSYASDHVAGIWPQCVGCHNTQAPILSTNAFVNARAWSSTTLYGPPSSSAYNMCGGMACISTTSSEYLTLRSWQLTGLLP